MLARFRPALGMMPALSDEQLPEGSAVLARDCKLSGLNMKPWKALGAAVAAVAAGVKSIHKYNALWFSWAEDADVCRSPLAEDAYDRVYFTREGLGAFFTYDAIATAGATAAHKLGLPAPSVAPTATWSYTGALEEEAGDDDDQLSGFTVAGLLSTHLDDDYVYWTLTQNFASSAAQLVGRTMGGADETNTDAGTLYFSIADAAGTRTVALFSDDAGAVKVAQGSLLGDGDITLAEVGGSGLSALVTLTYTGDVAVGPANTLQVVRVVTLTNKVGGVLCSGSGFSPGTIVLAAAAPGKPTGTVVLGAFVAPDAGINTLSLGKVPKAYLYTWVDAVGAEGPPSAAVELSVPAGAAATIVLPSAAPAGYGNVVTVRLYRANTGSEATSYQFVADVAIAAGTYADSVADGDLGEVLPSALWDAPPADLHGLRAHPAGFLVGYSPSLKSVCFSEPYFPHAWPLSYRIPLIDIPVGLGVFGMSIAVMTQGPPTLITGQTPGAFSVERYEAGLACRSKRSIVDLGEAIIYAAAEGLVIVSSGRVELLTKSHFTADEWAAYAPASLLGGAWDGNYLGFAGSSGFFFSKAGQFSELSDAVTALWRDETSGTLYLAVGAEIVAWQGSASPRTATFTSPVVRTPRPLNMGVAQVIARSYPVTFRLYADDALKLTKTVASRAVFRLPPGYLAERWQVSIDSAHETDEILLAGTMNEMKGA